MQDFKFDFQNVLGGGLHPPPPIAGGEHPLPHLPPSPLRSSITIVDGKNSQHPFQNTGYGPGYACAYLLRDKTAQGSILYDVLSYSN
ncbi:hypothetical protein DPMN_107120 [Dreissena polymorpha]|uniref:Uncharacterized protein n=1 Tax=Dreissena polymorpha TaxID=45954 RepID=A0A9D4QJU7_DREPO|nr:hypothetical protein DPMN_107120 [Dreissena polymorpha]